MHVNNVSKLVFGNLVQVEEKKAGRHPVSRDNKLLLDLWHWNINDLFRHVVGCGSNTRGFSNGFRTVGLIPKKTEVHKRGKNNDHTLCVLSRSRRLSLLVCSVAIPATVFPSCLRGLAALVSRKVFWSVMGSDDFQTKKKKSWVSGQVRAERILAEAMAGRSGRANSVRNRMRGVGGVAGGDYNNILAGLHGKYRQAIVAKSGEWSTVSSASSGQEDRKPRSLEAENKELRAGIDAMEQKARRAEYPFWRRRGPREEFRESRALSTSHGPVPS